jgi:hypothetical protein
LRSKKSGADATTSDPFDAKRPVGGNANETNSPTNDNDAVPAKSKANRPDLGDPSTVIPQKQPAPPELPPEEAAPEPNQPEALNTDEAATTTAVAPKTRLALSGRFSTPKVVRLKLRPNQDWIATPVEPVLAKHESSR